MISPQRWTIPLILVAAGQGCQVQNLPDPPSPEIRAQLGRIRIERVVQEADVSLDHPAGCCSGFCKGMVYGWELLLPSGDSTGSMVEALLVIPAIVLAFVYGPVGMVRGMPGEQVRDLEPSIRAAFDDSPLGPGLARAVLAEARRQDHYRVLGPEEEGPADTLLQLEIDRRELLGLSVKSEQLILDPPYQVVVRARVTLVRISEGREVYRGYFRFCSDAKAFGQWSENGGAAVRSSLAAGTDWLAERIVSIALEPPPK
jgi:hypothetical protein